jgi:transcriptional regulator with XRE-family HTH domain
METNSIADRIRQIRNYRGLKQAAVADMLGIHQQNYSTIERTNRKASLESLERVANVLEVDLLFLLATQVPVNKANIERFNQQRILDLFTESEQLKSKLSVYEDLLKIKWQNAPPQ